MAYDSNGGRVVMFGGCSGRDTAGKCVSSKYEQDLWEWDGVKWNELTPAPIPPLWPSARDYLKMAYDSTRRTVVMFGGSDGNVLTEDIWEWNGTTWANLTPPGTKPCGRQFHAVAYDSTRNRVLVFGGACCVEWDCARLRERPRYRPFRGYLGMEWGKLG